MSNVRRGEGWFESSVPGIDCREGESGQNELFRGPFALLECITGTKASDYAA